VFRGDRSLFFPFPPPFFPLSFSGGSQIEIQVEIPPPPSSRPNSFSSFVWSPVVSLSDRPPPSFADIGRDPLSPSFPSRGGDFLFSLFLREKVSENFFFFFPNSRILFPFFPLLSAGKETGRGAFRLYPLSPPLFPRFRRSCLHLLPFLLPFFFPSS